MSNQDGAAQKYDFVLSEKSELQDQVAKGLMT
jgi:hypothetical protein